MEESIVVDFTISTQKSRAFNLSPLLWREREGQIGSCPTAQAETSNLCQVCHKSGNPTFKGPETLDMALDSLHRKNNHTPTLTH